MAEKSFFLLLNKGKVYETKFSLKTCRVLDVLLKREAIPESHYSWFTQLTLSNLHFLGSNYAKIFVLTSISPCCSNTSCLFLALTFLTIYKIQPYLSIQVAMLIMSNTYCPPCPTAPLFLSVRNSHETLPWRSFWLKKDPCTSPAAFNWNGHYFELSLRHFGKIKPRLLWQLFPTLFQLPPPSRPQSPLLGSLRTDKLPLDEHWWRDTFLPPKIPSACSSMCSKSRAPEKIKTNTFCQNCTRDIFAA